MIKLLDLLKEELSDDNMYKITFQKGKYTIKKTTISEIGSISNLIYDFGGGEYWDENPSPNIVIVDNVSVEYIAKMPENLKSESIKYYIKHDLNTPFNLPKADKINISKLTHYLKNIEEFAKTVNNSLKPSGQIVYYTDTMNKKDKQFIQIMVEKYNFNLPTNVDINKLNQSKEDIIILQKNTPYNPPPQIYKFLVKNKKTNAEGIIQYEKIGNWWEETIISGNIPTQDFYNNNGKSKKWNGYPTLDDMFMGPKYKNYEPKRINYSIIKSIQ